MEQKATTQVESAKTRKTARKYSKPTMVRHEPLEKATTFVYYYYR